jgi:hypothetical protein
MKNFIININSKLKNIKITVKNGKAFSEAAIKGEYKRFTVSVNEYDLKEIKKYAVKNANDKSSNKGKWYAHCNGYSMDLIVDYKGWVSINTYRDYGKENPVK